MKNKKQRVILSIDPIKDMKQADIMAKVIHKLIGQYADTKEILVHFKQIDGSNNVYKIDDTDNEDTKVQAS